MKMLLRSFLLSLVIFGVSSLASAQNNFTLTPLTTFGGYGDGSIYPDDTAYVTFQFNTNSYQQRGMACDPTTGNLVIVDPHSGQAGSTNMLGSIYVVDGNTGAQLGTLSTNTITGGNLAASSAGIADDGVVYICNQVADSTNTPSPFKLYRWASTTSVADPTVAFVGALSPSQRYGSTMDIRGSGTGTQIIIGSQLGKTGTNVVILTTSDGVAYAANVIACTNRLITATATNNLGPFSTDGIAFGTNNTFWAKQIGGPLYFMSYDLTTKTARVLGSYSTNLPGYFNLATLASDNVNHLLAAIESNNGSERVWLFDITDPTKPPVLLSIRTFTPNNQNASSPLGNLDFGGGRLYAHVVNNGLLASTIGSQSTPVPIIDRDLPPVTRAAIGQTAHFEVLAYPAITGYQWQTNGVDITGATSFSLNVTNVQLSDSGRQYSVRVDNAGGSTFSSVSVLSVFNPASLAHLDLLWAAAPDSAPYVSNGGLNSPNERNCAFSALANQLYIVRRAGPFVAVYVLNPANGALLYQLRTDGINGGTIPLHAIAVADDGAIYACNVQDNTGNSITIYRWADSNPNTLPVTIFSGNPGPNVNTANTRWGDALAARGSGTGTQLIVDNNDVASALTRYIAIIQPSSSDLTQPWTTRGFVSQNQDPSLLTGRSLQFGVGDTFWQKRLPQSGGSPFVQSSFNLSELGNVAPIVASSPSSAGVLSTNGPAGIDLRGSSLCAAVNYITGFGNTGNSPDTLDLFDITSLATPVLLNSYNFPANHLPNGLPSAQTLFVTNSVLGKNMVFSLNGNNGITAYTYAFGPVSAPRFLLNPRNTRIIKGGTNSLVVVLDQNTPLQWQKDGVPVSGATSTALTVSGQFTNAGNYSVIATNTTGSTTSQVASVSIGIADDNYKLLQVWSKVPAATPGLANYVTSAGGANTPNERGFGYNALSNQVLVVQKQGGASAYQVHVVDGSVGTYLYDISTAGINTTVGSDVAGANGVGLVDIVAADDGAIFACNASPNASGGLTNIDTKKFQVYRWPNSGSAATLNTVFLGDPSGQGITNNVRWGDQMTIRGSGAGTELLFDSNDGARAAILKTNSVTGGFSNNFPIVTVSFNASIGRNTQFASGTNFWQKRRSEPLQLTTYNTNNQSSTFAGFNNYPASLGALSVDSAHNLAVGIDYGGSTNKVVLYEISDPNAPMLIASYGFPVAAVANNNSIGKVIVSGNKVFALNGNNGMVALTIQAPVGRPTLSISQVSTNALLSWGTNHVGWTLQSTPTLAPTAWANVPGLPGIVGTNFVSTNAIVDARFYRLIQ